jgi:hypothetical protein
MPGYSLVLLDLVEAMPPLHLPQRLFANLEVATIARIAKLQSKVFMPMLNLLKLRDFQ